MSAELDRLTSAARDGRCLLREKWEEGAALSAREQLELARVLLKVRPVTIERDGRRLPCEPVFELRPKDRRRLAAALVEEGAQDGFILANVPGLTARTFRRIKADMRPPDSGRSNGSTKGRIRPKLEAPLGSPLDAYFDASRGANPEAHRRLLAVLNG